MNNIKRERDIVTKEILTEYIRLKKEKAFRQGLITEGEQLQFITKRFLNNVRVFTMKEKIKEKKYIISIVSEWDIGVVMDENISEYSDISYELKYEMTFSNIVEIFKEIIEQNNVDNMWKTTKHRSLNRLLTLIEERLIIFSDESDIRLHGAGETNIYVPHSRIQITPKFYIENKEIMNRLIFRDIELEEVIYEMVDTKIDINIVTKQILNETQSKSGKHIKEMNNNIITVKNSLKILLMKERKLIILKNDGETKVKDISDIENPRTLEKEELINLKQIF